MIRKKIVLSFDYELFFGSPGGTAYRCMLEPTQKIIDIMQRYNKQAEFFIDVLYLFKLREAGEHETIELIEEQLRILVRHGHRIQLHLHPHWIDAIHENGKWIFPTYRNYRLHALTEDKIVYLFTTGKEYLEQIAKSVESDYKVTAFRAGGWSIEPFEKLRKAFVQSEIFIDSSAAYGMKLSGLAHCFDFTDIPDKPKYRFSSTVLKEDAEGAFLEVPISTYRTTILHKILRRLRRMQKTEQYRMSGDGKSIGGVKRDYLSEIWTYEMYTLESVEPKRILQLVERYRHTIVTLISHPKGMSPLSFESLEALCKSRHQMVLFEELL